ncbi:hypothetical protein PybrP1_002294 [[Pythium] brassicae (nom. inval.)]|nr:hypothetical protein PybrP1_002294 [[Pythium] brassicae (nom. inval.)]
MPAQCQRRRNDHNDNNSRLGIDLCAAPPPSQLLPPLRQPHTQQEQQQQERQALRDAFRERLRANRKLFAFASLLPTTVALDDLIARSGSRNGGGGATADEEHEDDDDDCVAFVERLARELEDAAPLAAHFVASLADSIRALVHSKLHAEATAAAVTTRLTGAVGSPRPPRRSDDAVDISSDLGESQLPSDSSSSSDAEESERRDRVDSSEDESGAREGAHVSDADAAGGKARFPTRRGRNVESPRGDTFRTSLRCRAFPPSRVPKAEHIVTVCTYTPFDQSKSPSDLSSIRLARADSGGSGAKQWQVVQFPKAKPRVSRAETEALIQWARRKLAALERDAPYDPSDKVARFHRTLALCELICYEMTRLVFDRCPTTARFLHGLFVELVDTALRTVTSADREAQVNGQRHKNAQQELQRLTTKLDAVRGSLASLEETLHKRQRHLLSERERIIRQRKKLNRLLCSDQVLIRHVSGLIQHLLDLSDDLLAVLTVDDPHGLLGGQPNRVFVPRDSSSSSSSSDVLRFAPVDELFELVTSKYESLQEVRRVVADVETARRDVDEAAAAETTAQLRSDQVIILDLDKVATATEDFKSALRRLNRLVSAKSPDSIVGWESQELWDQALFIPPHEDVQDLDRDVLRLCKCVEASILRQRHQGRALRCHASAQTDISACTTFRQRGRANGFVSFPGALQLQAELSASASATTEKQHHAAAAPSEHPVPPHLADEHQELLDKFLPSEFRRFIDHIPRDYSPRQLSLGVVHAVISYLYNETWLLVRDEFLQQPRRFTLAAGPASTAVPVVGIHEAVYRIYLLHFREPAFVTSRLLDLLVSVSRLDTQSCKVLLFCRLLNLPGVDPLPQDAFWFVLKTLHVLQRACTSAGNYFHLDASGENEFVPQTSATEALALLFRGATNDVVKRLRLRLAGLASVYGTIWIPAPSVVEFVVEEWKAAQDSLKRCITEQIAHEQKASPDKGIPTLAAFMRVFSELHFKVQRVEAAQAYRQLLSNSRRRKQHGIAADVAAATVDLKALTQTWVQLVLRSINQAQQQQHAPAAQHHSAGASAAGSRAASASSGIHFGPPSDALVAANRHLAFGFLKATWQQTKKDFIRSLDAAFHDVGLQVRLIQQMDSVVGREDVAAQVGWSSFQQLIEITSTGKVASYC